jgi:hypothetical protein
MRRISPGVEGVTQGKTFYRFSREFLYKIFSVNRFELQEFDALILGKVARATIKSFDDAEAFSYLPQPQITKEAIRIVDRCGR